MRFLFIVQGEGRGHMTQAISLQNILVRNGHEVVEVLVGKSERREIPAFFYEKIQSPISTYESPNFLVGNDNKRILMFRSVVYNLRKIGTFLRSLKFIVNRIRETKADVVINYYELLGGFTFLFHRPKVPFVCIGHQFLLLHSEFVFPKGRFYDRFLLNLNTRMTSFRAKKLLALSFVNMPDQPKKKIFVVPPLLRNEVLELQPQTKDYILGYMLNAGYAEEIIRWHEKHPELETHFFWDKKDAPEELEARTNLYFHRISDTKFLHYMKDCAAYTSTAGFESVCEAFYLQKPILMVPTGNHFEQHCNAFDAHRAGAGIYNFEFNLDLLLDYIPLHHKSDTFPVWVKSAEKRFLELLTTFS